MISSEEYSQAKPFPHCVIDDFYDPYSLEGVLREWPEKMSYKEAKTSVKAHLSDFNAFGPVTQKVIADLNSPEFLRKLEAMTGIEGLIPDPYLKGGGLHFIPHGGWLNIHADFNWHEELQAVRKINLLLYLNKGWKWNGQLQLCDKERKPVKEVDPIFNRCVIFNTTSDSYHGHPDPLVSPVPRVSIALYYYQKAEKPDWVHSTLYV
jgi:Rps23 Pro-64 3,4-dihydroxylase Tpa1-like proline 4-hydroxylase